MTAPGHIACPSNDFSVQGPGLVLGVGTHEGGVLRSSFCTSGGQGARQGTTHPSLRGVWLVASWDAVSGPGANETVWEQSLLESQVAELMPGHHQSSWKDAVVREGQGRGEQCKVTCPQSSGQPGPP